VILCIFREHLNVNQRNISVGEKVAWFGFVWDWVGFVDVEGYDKSDVKSSNFLKILRHRNMENI